MPNPNRPRPSRRSSPTDLLADAEAAVELASALREVASSDLARELGALRGADSDVSRARRGIERAQEALQAAQAARAAAREALRTAVTPWLRAGVSPTVLADRFDLPESTLTAWSRQDVAAQNERSSEAATENELLTPVLSALASNYRDSDPPQVSP